MCTAKDCVKIIKENRKLIEEEYGVKSIMLFGSVARGDDHEGSDIDLLVDMPARIVLIHELKTYLEKILNSSVDLVRKHSHLSDSFLTQISHEAIRIL